ncbi:MAG: VapC toxin family PIN domain ribonuclease [Cyanobium sp.]|uniref:type II toxin-antitoxin system VapC family toxin n=1 Tax=Synechococcus sp. CS-1333 TaxID=2848638 RepID=UPI000DBBF961|nr:type II toxin-antitoxin system VapC family toxin [Synechococcus sp. CS-1333]MCT0209767.1 type II toxin-antitoxin system VapC family toxin [Synechococcus sp. CS-1333]PZV23445.1 MAG: VapC toxin family PIN domain ribonuclease [Cyanobium sp.]
MYLLHTNVVSELRKPRPHGAVLAWLDGVDDANLHLATVTLGEIQAGIEITREQDPGKASELEAWLDLVSLSYNVLPMDGSAFRCWARLMHRQSNTLYEDAMIAAIAKVNHLTVVTRNGADFQTFEVPLLNPFETDR